MDVMQGSSVTNLIPAPNGIGDGSEAMVTTTAGASAAVPKSVRREKEGVMRGEVPEAPLAQRRVDMPPPGGKTQVRGAREPTARGGRGAGRGRQNHLYPNRQGWAEEEAMVTGLIV